MAAGTLTEDWRAAFAAVPRHAFIPDLTWQHGTANGRWGLIPRCRADDPDEGAGELWFLDPWSGSWASHFHVTPDCGDDEFSVRQRGPRRLWDEVRAAHTWWTEQGRPDEQDWVFTINATQQNIALN
ncbi:MAG: hypothetical protein ACRDQ4_26990 [Pseudonocardiaceae bacterium]